MPSTGIFSAAQYSKNPSGTRGEPSTCTLLGPPESTTTLGDTDLTRSRLASPGNIIEKSPISRTRRQISCVYWLP